MSETFGIVLLMFVCVSVGYLIGAIITHSATVHRTCKELTDFILVDKKLLDPRIAEMWDDGKLILKLYFHAKERTKPKLVRTTQFNGGKNDQEN